MQEPLINSKLHCQKSKLQRSIDFFLNCEYRSAYLKYEKNHTKQESSRKKKQVSAYFFIQKQHFPSWKSQTPNCLSKLSSSFLMLKCDAVLSRLVSLFCCLQIRVLVTLPSNDSMYNSYRAKYNISKKIFRIQIEL